MDAALYNVLIVDDEEEVIRIIIDTMNWEEMGFHLWGYAHNGVEALEMCEESVPDVVLTDIKMPYMDGLTLGRRLRELDPDIRLVIFSGFDEFEYAKEAIKLEAEEYLLKPIDAGELRAVFAQVKENLDRVRAERSDLDKLKEYYLESLPILQEGFFAALLEGRLDEAQISRNMTDYRIDMKGPLYLAAAVHISNPERSDDMTQTLRMMQVRKLLDTQETAYRFRTVPYMREIVLLAELDRESEVTGFTDAMDVFARAATRQCGAPVTVGLGDICSQIMGLTASYRSASKAVTYRATYGAGRAVSLMEIKAGSSFAVNAMEYVKESYADPDISIETVCHKLGVSAAYFSTVFKKETGRTFINFLTDYRMEKAVELLLTSADRTYMIADKVGYADANYFSYVFKKKYGMSPSKYRQQHSLGSGLL